MTDWNVEEWTVWAGLSILLPLGWYYIMVTLFRFYWRAVGRFFVKERKLPNVSLPVGLTTLLAVMIITILLAIIMLLYSTVKYNVGQVEFTNYNNGIVYSTLGKPHERP